MALPPSPRLAARHVCVSLRVLFSCVMARKMAVRCTQTGLHRGAGAVRDASNRVRIFVLYTLGNGSLYWEYSIFE